MGTNIKSLNLFNLDDLFAAKVKDLIVFISQNKITNKKDVISILSYYIFCEILKIYKSQSGLVLFYMSTKCYNWLLSDGGIVRDVDFKKVIELFTKKIKFPIVITSLSYEEFKALLASNSPVYDEILNDYNFIGDFWEEILKVIKSLKFYTLDEELSRNFTEHVLITKTFKR